MAWSERTIADYWESGAMTIWGPAMALLRCLGILDLVPGEARLADLSPLAEYLQHRE